MSNVKNQCHCHPIFFFSFLTTCCQVIYFCFLLVQVQFWDQYLSSRNDAKIGRDHFFPLLTLIPIPEFVCMLSDTEHWSHVSVIQNTYASLFLILIILYYTPCTDLLSCVLAQVIRSVKHEQTQVKQNTNINTWSCLKLEATQVACHWILATCVLKNRNQVPFGANKLRGTGSVHGQMYLQIPDPSLLIQQKYILHMCGSHMDFLNTY